MSQFPSWVCAALTATATFACSSSSDQPVSITGAACAVATQCFAGVEAGALRGAAVCIDKIPGGYCTHTCASDADCCAIPGECVAGRAEVCAPFESANAMYCLVSCEDADVIRSQATDATALCTSAAGPSFGCRSSGGGSANRKFCSP